MNKLILTLLKSSDDKIKLKEIKKSLKENEYYTNEEINETINDLVDRGKIIIENNFVSLIKEKKKSRSESLDDIDDDLKSKKIKKNNGSIVEELNDQSPTVSSLQGMYPELWRTGESLWREDGFDHEYLRSNPDGITRIFCGNLNRNITEKQLRSHIENIIYIKWITDKETQQFYGSTFLEMKNSKAAIDAVMKNKQKLFGR
jgi:hypothetical protein